MTFLNLLANGTIYDQFTCVPGVRRVPVCHMSHVSNPSHALHVLNMQVKSVQRIPGESEECASWRKKTHDKRKRVAIIVVILVILFFICWVPSRVYIFLSFFSRNKLMIDEPLYIYRIGKFRLCLTNILYMKRN